MPSLTIGKTDLVRLGPTMVVKLKIGTVAEHAQLKQGLVLPEVQPLNAMIDTGAAATVIREDILAKLNLRPTDQVRINTPTTSAYLCYRYWVRLVFPKDVTIETVVVSAPLEGQHVQCLIGRNVLSYSTFFYNGPEQSFTIGF